VRFQMMPGSVLGVVCGVEMVRVRHMGVVCGCCVVAVEMLLGGFAVMACSVFVMIRCLGVMMGCLAGHGSLLSLRVDLGYSTRGNYWRCRAGARLQPGEFGMKFCGYIGKLLSAAPAT
jgi:hypothetical protein